MTSRVLRAVGSSRVSFPGDPGGLRPSTDYRAASFREAVHRVAKRGVTGQEVDEIGNPARLALPWRGGSIFRPSKFDARRRHEVVDEAS